MKKQYMKYLGICLCAMLAVGLTACFDDEFDIAGGGDLTLKVTATTSFSGEEARAILDESQSANISNYCLLVFDKKAADGNLIFAADLTSSDLSNTTYSIPNSSQFAMLLGNVTLSQLGLSVGSSTVSSLYSAMADVNAGDNNFNDASRFTWSDCLDVSTTTTALAFNLKPNVAKVIVNVTNSSPATGTTESVQLLNLQVRNVMNKVRYAQNALNDAGLFVADDNKNGDPSVMDYNREAVNGTTASSVWYVPVNMCGTGNRTSNIPSEATYIEVTGVRGVDHLSTAYRIYLGVKSGSESYKDMTNFDVLPDKIYNVSLTISNDGLTFDVNTGVNKPDKPSSVANLVKLPSNANCHMINPNFSKTASGYPVYELPINRIDECWGPSGQIPDASMRIGDNEEWTMDVIWQDINARVIQFCDKNGNNAGDSYSGKGYTPAYFKIYPGTVTSSHYGNILVGVKKKGSSDYLWSWHLWITDYNPDVAAPYSSGTYIRESTGANGINGNVQHWYHTRSLYWGTSKFLSGAIWNSGLYKNAWIMDRNLGAISSKPWKDTHKSYGLYYQWGSKNPFPHASYKYKTTAATPDKNNPHKGNNELKGLYTITGSATTSFTLDAYNTSQKTYQEVTKKPNIFYGVSGNQLYVDSYGSSRNNIWSSPVSITNRQKSIFDPCPPGWTVPVYDIMDFMTISAGRYVGNTPTADEVSGFLGWYTLTSESWKIQADYCTFVVFRESDNSLYYGQKDFALAALVYGTNEGNLYHAHFPVQGVLSASDGGISSNSKSYFWFSEPSIMNANQGDVSAIFTYDETIGSSTTATTFVHSTGTYREKTGSNRQQNVQELYTNNGSYTYEGQIYYDVWNGRMCRTSLIKSRGHNVRCIQLPDKETLKYYNK